MKSISLTKEQLETLSYDDVAYLILENNQNKMKIQDLFKEVIDVMNLGESAFEEHLADFFELLSTDKRFIMLEKGYWDLKINHKTKIVIDEDEEDEEMIEEEATPENNSEEETDDINYDDDIIDDDDEDDDLKDLVIMDENEENELA